MAETSTPVSGVLCVNAYGRLEELLVQPLTLRQLCSEARQVFDLPSTTELVFRGPDGRPLDDEALRNAASVYLELPDTGLHDLEQRIDQLQHMQVSHLCDRLSQLAEEQVSHQVSIAGLTDALIEEQAFRQDFEEAVRAEIKHESDGVALHLKKRMDQLEIKMREHMDDALHAMESRMAQDFQELWQWTTEECRECKERLKELEQRVISSSATAREASLAAQGQRRLSERLDDLGEALLKEVQERLAEGRALREELAAASEAPELRDGLSELWRVVEELRRESAATPREGLAAADAEEAEVVAGPLQALREECLESIQREVRSRLQDSAKLRQALEMESKSRKEAFGLIQRAVSQC